VPQLLHHMRHTPGFAKVGSRMLWEWNEGMKRMTDRLGAQIPDFRLAAEQAGLPAPTPPQHFASKRIGESELLAPRRRKQPPLPS